MRFDVLTLFPGIFDGYLREALPRWAAADGLAQFHLHDFGKYMDESVATPNGEVETLGPGKKLPAKPVMRCVTEVLSQAPGGHLVMLSPTGRKLRQGVVKELADHSRLVLLCGRFGGFDDRIREALKPDEISIGDYVLSGGEPAAMVLIDAVLRLVPGVLPIGRGPDSPVAGKQNKEEASPPLLHSFASSSSVRRSLKE